MTQGAQATTGVSGAIVANTTWSLANSPYQVTGDISVANGATLTIEAGVVVYFDVGKNLVITGGALNARGTAGQPITFTSAGDATGGTAAPGNWGQLRFLDGTNDSTTIIEYAQIRYGQGISVQAASPTFNYLQITNNLGSAISIDLNSSPKGVGNQASGNTLNGISVPAGDLTGNITWGIKGIPYVVSSGIVSVGSTPTVNSLSISEIQQGETINAAVNGIRLAGVQSVTLSNTGVTAIAQSGATDTMVPIQLTASQNAALGATDIALQVNAGRPALAGALQVIQPQPTITGLSPNSLYATQADIGLSVTGKNFVPDSVIRIDGADLTTVYASATSLSTILPVQSAGNKSITVKQPDPLSAGNFLVSKPAVLNVIVPQLSLSPASASRMLGASFNLTVTIPFSAPAGGVTINLASSAAGVATVPANVAIIEGATSATVPVTTVGVGVASITASKAGFTSASVQVQVLEPPTLSITSTKPVDVVGSNFSFAINSNNSPGPGGLVIALSSSNTAVATVPATVTIPQNANSVNIQVAALAIGTATITAEANGFIAGAALITVRPVTQSVTVSPLPVAIPPDNVPRTVTLKLAAVDAIDHVFAVTAVDTTVVTLGAAGVTIPAGQTSAQLQVTGKKEGVTTINLVSSTLGNIAVPVYVTAPYTGTNASYSPLVGVVKETPAAPAQLTVTPVTSPLVGVVKETSVAPVQLTVTPVASPLVGVVRETSAAPAQLTVTPVASPLVGVVRETPAASAQLTVTPVASPLVGVFK